MDIKRDDAFWFLRFAKNTIDISFASEFKNVLNTSNIQDVFDVFEEIEKYSCEQFMRTFDPSWVHQKPSFVESMIIISALIYCTRTTIIYQELPKEFLTYAISQWLSNPEIVGCLSHPHFEDVKNCIDIRLLGTKPVTLDVLIKNLEIKFMNPALLFQHVPKENKVDIAYAFAQIIHFHVPVLSEMLSEEIYTSKDFDNWKKVFKLGSLIDILSRPLKDSVMPEIVYNNISSEDFKILCKKANKLGNKDWLRLASCLSNDTELTSEIFYFIQEIEKRNSVFIPISPKLEAEYRKALVITQDFHMSIEDYCCKKISETEEISLCL